MYNPPTPLPNPRPYSHAPRTALALEAVVVVLEARAIPYPLPPQPSELFFAGDGSDRSRRCTHTWAKQRTQYPVPYGGDAFPFAHAAQRV